MNGSARRRLAVGLVWGVPGTVLAGVSGYLSVLTIAAWWGRADRRRHAAPTAAPWRRFAVLIPAHDEERLIGSTLDSLASVDYPRELVSVHVVADNCTDDTVSIARDRGVEVHERIDPEAGGKGPALVWAWDRLRRRGDDHDAAVIIDADTVVNAGFLTAVAAELDSGAQVVQSYYAVRDAEASPVTAFRQAALAARHYLRPLGRTTLGGTAGLHGNGMVFAAPVLAAHQWSSHLTEDVELQIELLLDGTRVAFAPDAVVQAEMPVSVAASQTQHERWERGRIEMARRYLPVLARRALSARGADRVAYADAAADLAVPPFSVVVAASAAWSTLVLTRALVRRRVGVAGVAATSVVAAQAAYVLSGLRMVGARRAVYQSLLGAPRLVAWKIRLWVRQIGGRRDVVWTRTARNAESGPSTRIEAGADGRAMAPAR